MAIDGNGVTANTKLETRKRLLIVGMANSIHVARWLELLVDLPYEVELISSNPSNHVHPKIDKLVRASGNDQKMILRASFITRRFSVYMWLADRIFQDWIRAIFIALRIAITSPDLVHVLELQNGGYPTSKAMRLLKRGRRPMLFVTNYGSDVYWYRKFPSHVQKLKRLLEEADYFSAECQRDVEIAKGLGFNKTVLSTCPVTGGISVDLMPRGLNSIPLSERRSIAIKGYQGEWGQALEAIDALLKTDLDILRKFQVELYSCDTATVNAARKLQELGISVLTTGKGELSHEQMLELFKRSRLYIGLSTSDGISTSMLEAMSQGAIPIQTNTSCANEWISSTAQGFVVALGNSLGIANAVERVLSDDAYVISAQASNFKVIESRYDRTKIKTIVEDYYAQILNEPKIG